MMIRVLCLLTCLTVMAAFATAQTYSVTSGSLTGYSDIASPTNLNMGAASLSTEIKPSGFSFTYFGQTYTGFKIGSGGYMIMGGNGTVISKFAQHSTAPGLVLSPNWNYLQPGVTMTSTSTNPGPGTVGWEFASGVLSVEWKNVAYFGIPNRGVRMKILLDTTTGRIEYQYGAVPAGSGGAIANYAHTVAISGPVITTGGSQVIVDGAISGFISANGAMTVYPTDHYLRFSPSGTTTNNPPTLQVSANGSTVGNGGGVSVAYGDTVAAQSIQIAVDDPDADPVTTSTTISNLGTTGIAISEWERASGTVSYTLTPTSGTFNTVAGATYTVNLVLSDGQATTNFTFYINQSAQPSGAPAMSVSDGASISHGQSAGGTNRDFGSQDIAAGSTSALSIIIANGGTAVLTITGFNMTGDAGEFVLDTNGVTSPLAASASTSFTIEFDPTSIGQKVAQVSFTHDDAGLPNPFSFEVTGLGTQSSTPAPIIVVRETDVSGNAIVNGSSATGIRAFGSMDISATPSAPITVFVQNTGTGTLTIGTPSSSNGDFTVNAGGFPGTLGVGASATFTVAFTPTASGAKSATITFTHDDASTGNPFNFEVTGTATTTGGGPGPGPGLTGGGSGSGGSGCVASTSGLSLWILLFVLGASLGARSLGRRESR